MKGRNLYTISSLLRNPAMLATAVLLFLNFALALWDVLISAPETEHLQAAIIQQRQLLEQQDKRAKNGNSKERNYLHNERLLQDFFARTPDHSELPALLEELFTYAKQLGLSIERINYRPQQVADPGLVRYGLSFQLEGSYDQIKHMIFLLEHSPRTIALNRLQLQRHTGKSSKVVLGLDLDTYFAQKGA